MKTSHLINISAVAIIMIFAVSACNCTKKPDQSQMIADADRAYSAISVEKGMNAAFLAMFDSAGVILRANREPVKGYNAIKDLLINQSDSAFILSWEPAYAQVAASGDIGYTYGTYQVTDKATDSISGEGTYVTIWQKQPDGKWKALLDTGNPGLGKKK